MRLNSAFLYTSTAAIIWGATAPIMKLTLEQIPPFSLAFLRFSIAAIILGALTYKINRSLRPLKIHERDLPDFVLCALTGVTLNISFFFLGLKFTEAILASFIIAAVPLLTLLAANIFLKEKFTKRLIIASAFAFSGLLLIVGKVNGTLGTRELFGNILLLGSAASWVAYEIFSKKLFKKYDANTITFYTMAIGALTFAPLFFAELVRDPTWTAIVNIKGLAGLFYGIFFSSLIAYISWNKGLKLMRANQAAFFFYLDPISGAALSILLLGEKLTPQLLMGGTLIAAAVVLAEKHREAHILHKRA
ncbi:MAG TPA: DMT family transporter [Candidatus Saccharimonadales bacterium]|nr:DMT family transporter [Candidatus Saccharimonadales bacterium]